MSFSPRWSGAKFSCVCPEIVDHFCKLIFLKKGKYAWGDKTPHYIFDLDIIYKIFPNAKYIYIVRDGRDVALSLLRKTWGPNNLVACGIYWKEANSHPLLNTLQVEGKMFKVKYEDLLTNSFQVVDDLFKFLDIKVSEKEVQKIIEPIKSDNFNKWKKEMSKAQIDLFERATRPLLYANGYKVLSNSGELSFGEIQLWRLHNAFFRFLFLIRINTVDWFLIKFFNKEPFDS